MIVHETSINCTLVPESTFFLEDISGQLWNLTQNGTVSKFKSQLLFASLNKLVLIVPWLQNPHFFLEDISGQLWNLTQNGTVSKFKSQLLFASLKKLVLIVPWLQNPHFFLEDISGQLWNLTQNGTVSKFKSQLLFASLNKLSFRLPKLRGFGSHLVRPHFHKLDQPMVLDLISANDQSLQDISQITDIGQGSFLQGLGSLFGIMIRSLAQGGQAIIKAIGNGVNHEFEGKVHLAMTLPQE